MATTSGASVDSTSDGRLVAFESLEWMGGDVAGVDGDRDRLAVR
jgi:hypothetical protein